MKNYLSIDLDKLKNWMKKNNLTQAEVSEKIGRGKSYISNVIQRKTIHNNAYTMLVKEYGLPYETFLEQEKEQIAQPEPKHGGYWVEVQTFPDKVRFQINFSADGTDVEVAHAYSRVRGSTELDLVQAISYAAHMVYKIVEQKTIEK